MIHLGLFNVLAKCANRKRAVIREGLTPKQAWWAGVRAGLGLPPDTPRSVVAERPRTLREAANSGAASVSEPAYPIVLVEWQDSYGAGPEWTPISELTAEPHHCFSIGWLIAETVDCLIIMPHLSPARESIGAKESGCGEMTIHTRAIVSRAELKRPRLVAPARSSTHSEHDNRDK